MKKYKLISFLSSIVGILMISSGLLLSDTNRIAGLGDISIEEFNIQNLATSTDNIVRETSMKADDNYSDLLLSDISMNTAPSGVYRVEVFDGLTMEELAAKLNRSLRAEISGKGYVIASKCLELGVDPYVATAIILHETGCGQGSCSHIARTCYNFGGQKGSGCGAYQRYGSIDEGLNGMISNLYRNFYAKGLTTIDSIAPRYAESSAWPAKIHGYVARIRAA